MAQTDILRQRLFNVEKTDGNCLYFSHIDVQNAEAEEKKNEVNVKAESMHSVPQLFNNLELDLTLHGRSGNDGDNTIFKDRDYFLKHYTYKLIPITLGKREEKNDAGKKTGVTVEEVDGKLINMEHDYCSVSSESDGEFEFSRTITYQVYRKRNRSKRKGRIKRTESSMEESPNGTGDIDIIDTNGSNADLHLIEPDYSELSFYSKNLFSYKEENHSEGLQPIDLSLSLPEENKTEDNAISSPTEIEEEKEVTSANTSITAILSPTESNEEKEATATNFSVTAILSPTENVEDKEDLTTTFNVPAILTSTQNNEEKENSVTDFNVPAISSSIENNEEKENSETDLNVPAMSSSTENNEEKENSVTDFNVPATLPPAENSEETEDVPTDLSIPASNKESVTENDIKVMFSRPGFPDYKPSKEFIHNIAKKVPDLLKDESDKINILDCTYGSVNSDGTINYYFIAEETWRLFKNSSERIILTNDTNCGERVKVNKENDIPTFLVFDESSLADSLKTICKDIGYNYKFTLLEDTGEKLVKILENEDCTEQSEEQEMEESKLVENETCDEQPSGVINSGRLRNLLLKSRQLKSRNQIEVFSIMNETSLNPSRRILPLKKSWKIEDVLLVLSAEDAIKKLSANSRKKEKRKSKRSGIINSGLLRAMLLKNNPLYKKLVKRSNNLVNGFPVNQNDSMCSDMPSASQKVKKVKKDDKNKKSRSNIKRSREISIEEIVDLGLHLGKRTRSGIEEFEIAKKSKKGSKKNEDNSLVNTTANKTTENLRGKNSILSKLLLEGVKNDGVPKLQPTEIHIDEKLGVLNLNDAKDREKLEKALLSEKMRNVKMSGLQKKREAMGKNKKKKCSSDGKVKKVEANKLQEGVESVDGKIRVNEMINSIIEEACGSVRIKEETSSCVQIKEPIGSKIQVKIQTNGNVKIKGANNGRGKMKKATNNSQSKVRRGSYDDPTQRRGRPRKNNALYEQCFLFQPSNCLSNPAQSNKPSDKNNQVVVKKEKCKDKKIKAKKNKEKKGAKEENDLIIVMEILVPRIKTEPIDEPTFEFDADDSNQSFDTFERNYPATEATEIENKENNPNGNIEEAKAPERLEERAVEVVDVDSSPRCEVNNDSQISTLNETNEEDVLRKDQADAMETSGNPQMSYLSVLVEERHTEMMISYLKEKKEAPSGRNQLETIEVNDEGSLEKREVCCGRNRSEVTEGIDDFPNSGLSALEIKQEQFSEKNENLNEEKDEVQQEEAETKGSINEESNCNSKRTSRSKTLANKPKKRTKEEKGVKRRSSEVTPPRTVEPPPALKSPIIAKKGELNIETNIISPVVQIEKNKEIEEAVTKQLEENTLSPVRVSTRPRKIPRIFDESLYAIDPSTKTKKVKKSPEEEVDPDYRPKMKTRRGGKSDVHTPAAVAAPKNLVKSIDSDSLTSSQCGDAGETKKISCRTELYDPLLLNYERTTRSGTRFENDDSFEGSELKTTKNNASNNMKINSRRKTVGCSKAKTVTTVKTKKPEQKIEPSRLQRTRHSTGCIEKEKKLQSTRFSARLKNV